MYVHKTYETKRLVLRPLEFSDYETWLASQEKTLPARDKFATPELFKPKRRKARQ